ncbi:MAG: alanine racemase, partial [Anaerolineales bacterium]|nr:alanine racemase [Anaerolineales bacterium]
MMLENIITWAEIDLDAIAYNVQAFKHYVGEKVDLMAVVKANAYGHGAVRVARAALQAGAARLAVHRLVEGIELRRAGLQAPILIM